ncbi:ABC-type phosphate transport system, periplasmic component [Levilactobacillus namurensis DSM 19117]|uniref:Phosphate-binding protein n=1 Tax=Levilactobacillus namurensis DSM 19117 TaxID=1423773 RepID=A0A0R1JYS1_9LACO|nr:phosphate ABC transporter substrate-binding protein PstS family protein [Levilactobacillus namurensis]KRK76092.1 ABC-type phosphate transport system, periplasmic component [Levilactobacillus namurensis DSM 19117]GEO74635.1 phosphate-binding protein [Levilactobacillus namurensis]
MTKKRWFQGIGLILLVALGVFAYQTRQVSHAGQSITAVGSTALQPLVEAAGEQYTGEHLGTFINVQGGGTGTGLSQIQEGAVQIGNSDLFASEQKGITSKQLVDHRVAVVGITPIVNRKNGVQNLTTQQLTAVFTGQVTNWKQVGGADRPIVIINRAQGSGTRATFEKFGMNGHRSRTAQEQDSSGMVRQIVATTPGAISYVAFSYVDKTVDALHLNGVAPTEANVIDNHWKIWSYEHLYTNGQPTGLTKDFIAYVESPAIQKTLVRQLGYLSPDQMHIERDVTGKVTQIGGAR